MPQPVNYLTGGQWQMCGRCGWWYPMGQLTKQLGLLVCNRNCYDNLLVNQRASMIARTLSSGTSYDQELMDRRSLDMSFFTGFDEVNS